MNLKLARVFSLTFYLIVFLLPLNLGKHLIFNFSYVDGVLVDYWIPTIFIQDLLIVAFLVMGLFLCKFKLGWFFYITLGLLLLNLVFSIVPLATIIYTLRIIVYLLFCIVVFRSKSLLDTTLLFKALYISVFFTCVLALGQWFKQASVFNNYLFFGEQPYLITTSGILKHYLFDNIVIPPYATFRHPNALGGFLSVLLVLFAYYLKGSKKHFISVAGKKIPVPLDPCGFILLLGSTVLFLTFSYAAWFSYLFGLLFISVKSPVIRKFFYLVVFVVFTVGIFGFFDFDAFTSDSLVHRRFLLTQSAAHSFEQYPLTGTGLNTSLFTGKDLSYLSRELNFFQPVHNVFWLLLSEGGLLIFFPFLLFYLYALQSAKSTSRALSGALLQFVILGSFDHYLLTMHQTLLFFMLTIAFCINYTFRHEI